MRAAARRATRRDAHCVAEEIRVDAVGLAEGVEAGELIFCALIGERDLVLLRLTRERLRLFAAELRGKFGSGGGVIGGGGAIGGAFAERVERGVCRAHALLRDCRLLGGRVAGAGEQRLNRGQQERAVLRALLIRLRDELVLLRELLIGELAGGTLCAS